jgi:hypothetical protein
LLSHTPLSSEYIDPPAGPEFRGLLAKHDRLLGKNRLKHPLDGSLRRVIWMYGFALVLDLHASA